MSFLFNNRIKQKQTKTTPWRKTWLEAWLLTGQDRTRQGRNRQGNTWLEHLTIYTVCIYVYMYVSSRCPQFICISCEWTNIMKTHTPALVLLTLSQLQCYLFHQLHRGLFPLPPLKNETHCLTQDFGPYVSLWKPPSQSAASIRALTKTNFEINSISL